MDSVSLAFWVSSFSSYTRTYVCERHINGKSGVDTQLRDTHTHKVNCNIDFVEHQDIKCKHIHTYVHPYSQGLEFSILVIIISRINGLHTYLQSLAQTPSNGTPMSLYTCTYIQVLLLATLHTKVSNVETTGIQKH